MSGALWAGLGSEGLGLLIGLWALVDWRHNVDPEKVSIMTLISGILLTTPIAGFLGGLKTLTFLGVSFMLVILAIGGRMFWHQAIKGRKSHHSRTPLLGLLVGVAIGQISGGVIGTFVNTVTTTGIHVVQHIGS